MSKILIDADSIIYIGAVIAEVAEVPMFKKDNVMKQIIRQKMDDMQTRWPFWDMKIAIRGKNNFRKIIYPQYKANRDPAPELRLALIEEGGDYMKKYWDVTEAHGMEADDLICIWAYECMADSDDYIIAGIDKDLKQIPGKHFNYKHKSKEIVDADTAYRNLMHQCLTGDSSDNIPGVPGIGQKRAEDKLRHVPVDRMWDTVRSIWRDKGVPDPELSHRLLAMIKTWDEFNDVRKLVQEKSLDAFNETKTTSKTSVSEQDVLPEQEQDEGIQTVSGGSEGRDDGNTVDLF